MSTNINNNDNTVTITNIYASTTTLPYRGVIIGSPKYSDLGWRGVLKQNWSKLPLPVNKLLNISNLP